VGFECLLDTLALIISYLFDFCKFICHKISGNCQFPNHGITSVRENMQQAEREEEQQEPRDPAILDRLKGQRQS
jgi:hypothetical protein